MSKHYVAACEEANGDKGVPCGNWTSAYRILADWNLDWHNYIAFIVFYTYIYLLFHEIAKKLYNFKISIYFANLLLTVI